ncbi:major facilitator superfamily-domain-containing protein [Chaetomium sp. MPI-CAGE-AT-0009]|nr:major facilitator superfamily-domain-containing protein [Chaetomium sp. MPI-CAGE-AT-0009]
MTNGGFQSSWGKAYRYFPLKFTFLMAIAVFELGSLICAVAPNSTAFIVGRAINGLGAAGIGTGAYTIIAFVAEPSKRATYTGFVGMSFGVACVVGPLIGGVFADKVTWRWCFWINLPVGGLSALIILFFFQAPSAAKPVAAPWREKLLQMDPVGVALVMGAIVAFMLALQYGGQTAPWNSSIVIGLLVGFVLITAAFIVWEHFQGERAIVVPRLFKQRAICISCLFACIFVGSYYLIIYYIPIYFQSVSNASPTMSGVYNLPLIIATTIFMIASGMVISGTGFAVQIQVGGALIGVIAAGLLYTLDIDTSVGKWIGYQLLGGVGWGLAFQVPIIVGQANADPEDISSVTAMVLFFQCIGGTAFVTAAQAAFVNRIIQTLPDSAPNVDPADVVATGATLIRTAFPADQVPGIVVAYMAGIKVALGISIGGAGLGLVICLCSRWKRLNLDAVEDAVVAV